MTFLNLSVKLAFHALVFVIDAFSVFYEFIIIENIHTSLGGKFKFITIWCIIFHTIYFGLSIIVDLSGKTSLQGSETERSTLLKFRDLFHSTLAFPIAIFVVLTFWALYAVDKELVRPKKFEAHTPAFQNHIMHTLVLPFIVIDKLLVFHIYPRRLCGLLTVCGFASLYLTWILVIAYVDNFWVYPVLQYLRAHERAVFIGVCLAFLTSFYFIGESLTKFFWGTDRGLPDYQRASKIQKRN